MTRGHPVTPSFVVAGDGVGGSDVAVVVVVPVGVVVEDAAGEPTTSVVSVRVPAVGPPQ